MVERETDLYTGKFYNLANTAIFRDSALYKQPASHCAHKRLETEIPHVISKEISQ
jgi:hypothetical protein